MSGPTSTERPSAAAGPAPSRSGNALRVLIALGSNVDPERHLPLAVRRLAETFPRLAVSRLYATAPVGTPPGSPRLPVFHNAAVAVDTERSLTELKHGVLRPLEAALGRVRGPDRNAPRTLDLDIVFCGDLVLSDPQAGLTIPDPDILLRAHLALPLADLEPRAHHPLDGRTLAQIAAAFAGEPGVEVIGGPGDLWPGRPGE